MRRAGEGGKEGREATTTKHHKRRKTPAKKKKSQLLRLSFSPLDGTTAACSCPDAVVYITGRAVNMMYEDVERLEQGYVLEIRSRTGGGLGINKL